MTRKKNLLRAVAALVLCLTLSGCTFGTEVDSLLQTPKHSETQQEIYAALQDAVGSSFTLQYPRTGSNLSAFTLADLDGNGDEEALVFYEKSSVSATENSLRIGILDQIDDAWQSVCDIPAEGIDVERVEITDMGGKRLLCIGYGSVDQNEHFLTVCRYQDHMLDTIYTTSYADFEIADFDGNGEESLLILCRATESNAAYAMLCGIDQAGGLSVSGKVEFRATFAEFRNAFSQIDTSGSTIWIDGVVGGSTLETEILRVTDGRLTYALSSAEEVAATSRPNGYSVMDLDGDGKFEIPVQSPFPGYDENTAEQLKLTKWMSLSGETLVEKCRGYFSLSDGVMFLFPQDWYDNVTVFSDPQRSDIVFCCYDGKTPDGTQQELCRYCCVSDESEIARREDEGYLLLRTKGNAWYYLNVPTENSENSLSKDWQTLLARFLFFT